MHKRDPNEIALADTQIHFNKLVPGLWNVIQQHASANNIGLWGNESSVLLGTKPCHGSVHVGEVESDFFTYRQPREGKRDSVTSFRTNEVSKFANFLSQQPIAEPQPEKASRTNLLALLQNVHAPA